MTLITITHLGELDQYYSYHDESRARFMLRYWGFVEVNPTLYRHDRRKQLATVEVFYDLGDNQPAREC
jgi:hypothetical protein